MNTRPYLPLFGFPQEVLSASGASYSCVPSPGVYLLAWRTVSSDDFAYACRIKRGVDEMTMYTDDLIHLLSLMHHLIATHGGNA